MENNKKIEAKKMSIEDLNLALELIQNHELVEPTEIVYPTDACFHRADAETCDCTGAWSRPWAEVDRMFCFCCRKYILIKDKDGNWLDIENPIRRVRNVGTKRTTERN